MNLTFDTCLIQHTIQVEDGSMKARINQNILKLKVGLVAAMMIINPIKLQYQ